MTITAEVEDDRGVLVHVRLIQDKAKDQQLNSGAFSMYPEVWKAMKAFLKKKFDLDIGEVATGAELL